MSLEPRPYLVVTRVGARGEPLARPHVALRTAHPTDRIALGWLTQLEPVRGDDPAEAAEQLAAANGLERVGYWQLTATGARAWARRRVTSGMGGHERA